MTTHYRAIVFFLNTEKKTTVSSFSSQTQIRQDTQKNNQKNKPRDEREFTFKLPLCPLTFGSCFCFPLLHFYFKCFLLTSFFSNERKKKHKEKKTIKKKKYAKKGGNLLSSSHFALSLLAPTFAFPLMHFCFKRFLLASSSFQTEGKKKT
jgi:hypothetical protein